MPKVTVTLPVLVTLDVPEEQAKQMTREDIISAARNAVPDHSQHPNPLPNGVQVEVDEVCQEDAEGMPIFADVYHVEHDIIQDPDIQFDDVGFETAEKE